MLERGLIKMQKLLTMRFWCMCLSIPIVGLSMLHQAHLGPPKQMHASFTLMCGFKCVARHIAFRLPHSVNSGSQWEKTKTALPLPWHRIPYENNRGRQHCFNSTCMLEYKDKGVCRTYCSYLVLQSRFCMSLWFRTWYTSMYFCAICIVIYILLYSVKQ